MAFARAGGLLLAQRLSASRAPWLAFFGTLGSMAASCGGNVSEERAGVNTLRGGFGAVSGMEASGGGGGRFVPVPTSAAPTGGTGSSVGGDGPKPGFDCDGAEHCDRGERCVDCALGASSVGLCAPNPDEDAEAYRAAVAGCRGVGSDFSDCDGPEDCASGEYCVVADGRTSGRCQSEPGSELATCCFSCDAPPICTLCWIDNDCPMGFLCSPTDGAPNDVGGCRAAD